MSTRNKTTPIYPDNAEAITAGVTTWGQPSAIYVGGAGDVTVTPWGGGADVTFAGLAAGVIIPLMVSKVASATATGLIRLY